MKKKLLAHLLTLFGVFAVCAWGGAARARGGMIERWGEAQLQGDQVVVAREQAVNKAITECIKVLVGFTSQSKMTDYMKAVAQDEKQAFEQRIESEILTNARGFVKTYDVLREERKGDVFRALVRAEVYEDKLQSEMQGIIKLLAVAGNPKLMILLQEVHYPLQGNAGVDPKGRITAHMESVFQDWGFTIRGKAVGGDAGIQRFDAWLDNPSKMAAMARKRGADLVVAGRLELRESDAGKEFGLSHLHSGNLTGVINLVAVSTGTKLESIDVSTNSRGASFKQMVDFLIRVKLQHYTDHLLEAMRREFTKIADVGRELEVSLQGVTSFRAQGAPFKGMLEGLRGVTTVRQKSYDKGDLVFDVVCKCSGSELQSNIFHAVEGNAAFSTLDLASSSGDKLQLKL